MRNNLIIVYLLIFLSLLILLKSIGVVHINRDELIGYGLITYGLSLFYIAHIESNRLFIFIGSMVFLVGVLFFIMGNFEFEETDKVFFPAAMFMLSISSLMVFLYNRGFKPGLYGAVILFTAGISALALMSAHGIENLFSFTIDIFKIYWSVFIILLAVIVLVNRGLKEKEKDSTQ